MKMKFAAFILCAVLTAALAAADKLAVAEPIGRGGVSAENIEAFWGMLESSIHSDEYRLISRGALSQMMTEIGLTTSSDLLNLNSTQKAKLGQLEGVKYILVAEIGKFGSRLNCTLRIIDSSTGEIDQARTANLRVKDLDELADKIEATLEQLLSDDKSQNAAALLSPVIRVFNAPAFLANDFNIRLESALLEQGVELQNLQSVAKILRENNLGNLGELEPKMFVKVGKLLEVKYLIQATITRFEIVGIPYDVSETGASGFRYKGFIECNIRVVETSKGKVVASVPFEGQADFRQLDRQLTRDWTEADYYKYLIKTMVPMQIAPALAKISVLKK